MQHLAKRRFELLSKLAASIQSYNWQWCLLCRLACLGGSKNKRRVHLFLRKWWESSAVKGSEEKGKMVWGPSMETRGPGRTTAQTDPGKPA
jgi:hypothetical protein